MGRWGTHDITTTEPAREAGADRAADALKEATADSVAAGPAAIDPMIAGLKEAGADFVATTLLETRQQLSSLIPVLVQGPRWARRVGGAGAPADGPRPRGRPSPPEPGGGGRSPDIVSWSDPPGRRHVGPRAGGRAHARGTPYHSIDMMHTQFTIFKKGLTLIAVPLLVQAVFIAVLVKAQADHDRAQDWAVHTKDVIAKVEELHRSLVESYSRVRSLVFSVAPASPGRYRAALREVPGAARGAAGAGLGQSTAGAPDRRARRPVRRFLGWVADEERLVRVRRSGSGDWPGSTAARNSWRRCGRPSTRSAARRRAGPAADGTPPRVLGAAGLDADRRRRGDRGLDADPGPPVPPGDHPAAGRPAATTPAGSPRGRPLKPPLAGRDEITEVDRAFHEMADNLGQQKQENEMFVYSVSHDLRSPLVNLQGFSEELSLSCRDLRGLFRRDDVPEPVRPRARPAAHGPRHRGVDPLHPDGRGPAGPDHRRPAAALARRPGRVPVAGGRPRGRPSGKIVEALHDTITAKGAEVDVGELPPAWGDPTALEQVFANLIGNAVQYLDPAPAG